MRTTRLHHLKLAAALLCALTANAALAQGAKKPAQPAPAAAQPASAAAAAPAAGNGGFLPPASSNANVIDAIRVVVNDEVITRNEVRSRVAQIVQRLRAQNTQLPPQADIERQVIEAMIVERSQLQMAREMGVRVSDRELDAAIGRIAEGQKMSLQDMRNQMEKEGLTFAAFREEIRNEIMLQRLREHEVDAKIQVSDAEIDTYLAAEKAAASEKVEMDIAQILVAIPANATPEQVAARRARADEVARQLRTGADFAKIAATYSDAPDALKGGAIGWRDPDRLPPLIAEPLRKLSAGQVTPIIKSNNGFHILKLIDKRNLAQAPEKAIVQQTRARHILIKATPAMPAAQVKAKLADLRARIQNKSATFEDLARQNGQDSTAAKGGDLGWLAPEDMEAMPPEFVSAMAALKPGEVSDVVESSFGFHLIQVLERKTEDQTREKERLRARQVIRERKLGEAVEDWSREVRDRAYVEYREEA